jgi:hypothetical protein
LAASPCSAARAGGLSRLAQPMRLISAAASLAVSAGAIIFFGTLRAVRSFLGGRFFAFALVTRKDWLASPRGQLEATTASLDLYDRRSCLRRFGQRGSRESDCLCRRQRRQAHACGKNTSNEGFHRVSLRSLMKGSPRGTSSVQGVPAAIIRKDGPLTQNKAINASRSVSRTADAASNACTTPTGSGW